MSKEIVTLVWCDGPHGEVGDSVPIQVRANGSHTIAIDGRKPTELDLCDDCAKFLLEPLVTLLEEAGQPVPSEPAVTRADDDGRLACPECGKSLKQRGTLRVHLWQQHGKTLNDGPLICDEPGCDGREFHSFRALSNHKTRAHRTRA